MRSTASKMTGAAAAFVLLALPAAWAETFRGEVVQVQERVRADNGGEQQQITVRTHAGEELRFQFGAAGACEGCVQLGDQVRVRTTARSTTAAPQQARQVRQMAVARSDSIYTFCNRSGEPIGTQVRSGAGRAGAGTGAGGGTGAGTGAGGGLGAGDRMRDRDRLHVPGTGGGTGAGNRQGGGQR